MPSNRVDMACSWSWRRRPPQMRMRVKNAGAWQAPVDILTSNDAANMPLVNLMPDSGRYAGTVNPLAITLAQPWANSTFSSGWNGASFMDGGKFTHDNSSNGGGGAELNARSRVCCRRWGAVQEGRAMVSSSMSL